MTARDWLEKALIVLFIFDFLPVLFFILFSMRLIDISDLGWGGLALILMIAWVWCIYHLIITVVFSFKSKKLLVLGFLTLIQLVALSPVLISFSDGFPYAWVPVMFIIYISIYILTICGLRFVTIK